MASGRQPISGKQKPVPQGEGTREAGGGLYLNNGIRIRVKAGDIAVMKSGAVVAGENNHFTGRGAIASALLVKGGKSYKKNRDKMIEEYRKTESKKLVLTCSAGDKMKFEFVFHALITFAGDDGKKVTLNKFEQIVDLYTHVFELAWEKKVTSIATPLLCSGAAKGNFKDCILAAVAALSNLKQTNLEDILFVEYDEGKARSIRTHLKEVIEQEAEHKDSRHAPPRPRQLPAQVRSAPSPSPQGSQAGGRGRKDHRKGPAPTPPAPGRTGTGSQNPKTTPAAETEQHPATSPVAPARTKGKHASTGPASKPLPPVEDPGAQGTRSSGGSDLKRGQRDQSKREHKRQLPLPNSGGQPSPAQDLLNASGNTRPRDNRNLDQRDPGRKNRDTDDSVDDLVKGISSISISDERRQHNAERDLRQNTTAAAARGHANPAGEERAGSGAWSGTGGHNEPGVGTERFCNKPSSTAGNVNPQPGSTTRQLGFQHQQGGEGGGRPGWHNPTANPQGVNTFSMSQQNTNASPGGMPAPLTYPHPGNGLAPIFYPPTPSTQGQSFEQRPGVQGNQHSCSPYWNTSGQPAPVYPNNMYQHQPYPPAQGLVGATAEHNNYSGSGEQGQQQTNSQQGSASSTSPQMQGGYPGHGTPNQGSQAMPDRQKDDDGWKEPQVHQPIPSNPANIQDATQWKEPNVRVQGCLPFAADERNNLGSELSTEVQKLDHTGGRGQGVTKLYPDLESPMSNTLPTGTNLMDQEIPPSVSTELLAPSPQTSAPVQAATNSSRLSTTEGLATSSTVAKASLTLPSQGSSEKVPKGSTPATGVPGGAEHVDLSAVTAEPPEQKMDRGYEGGQTSEERSRAESTFDQWMEHGDQANSGSNMPEGTPEQPLNSNEYLSGDSMPWSLISRPSDSMDNPNALTGNSDLHFNSSPPSIRSEVSSQSFAVLDSWHAKSDGGSEIFGGHGSWEAKSEGVGESFEVLSSWHADTNSSSPLSATRDKHSTGRNENGASDAKVPPVHDMFTEESNPPAGTKGDLEHETDSSDHEEGQGQHRPSSSQPVKSGEEGNFEKGATTAEREVASAGIQDDLQHGSDSSGVKENERQPSKDAASPNSSQDSVSSPEDLDDRNRRHGDRMDADGAGLVAEELPGSKDTEQSPVPASSGKSSMPEGKMIKTTKPNLHLAGYKPECGTILIEYSFPNGTQGPEHPAPGEPYKGTFRRAFLPDNPEGQRVCSLLQKAFDRKLTFEIVQRGASQEWVVDFAAIPHKTSLRKGADNSGFPDPGYLSLVEQVLQSYGIP